MLQILQARSPTRKLSSTMSAGQSEPALAPASAMKSFQAGRHPSRPSRPTRTFISEVGGLGQGINGLGLNERAEPPSSDIVAATFRPHVETCIEAFGASCSMFESNFRSTKSHTAIPCSGTPASYLQRASATQKKRICSPEPRRGFIASIQFSNSSEFNQAGAHKQVAVASGESGVQGSVRLFARSAAGCAWMAAYSSTTF